MRDRGKLSFLVNKKEYKLLLGATLLNQPYEGFVKRALQTIIALLGGSVRLMSLMKKYTSLTS